MKKKNLKEKIDFLKQIIKDNKASIVLSLFFILIIFVGYEYYKNISDFRNPNKIKEIILSYGSNGVLVYLMFQIIQVVAFFIPGEIIQIAGGYIYDTTLGSILSIVGIVIGSSIVYGISHVYGKPLIEKIISKKEIKFFDKILNLGEINFVVFLLYLIPGIPKDALGYICGISKISFKNFFIFSTLGRIPGIIISAYFGANINAGSRPLLWGIGITAVALFLIGVIKGEKIVKNILKK